MFSIHHTSSGSKPQQRRSRALRIRASGTLDGWYFAISDAKRRLLAYDAGFLPTDFMFNKQTALLYGLAQAHRYVTLNFPNSHVAMLSTAPRLQLVERREASVA